MNGIRLEISATSGDCHRCGLQLLLTTAVPSTMVNGREEAVGGSVRVALCGHCDADMPNARPLIMFLVVHDRITDNLVDQFAEYATNWITDLVPPTVDEQAWAEDLEAWQRGDFDSSDGFDGPDGSDGSAPTGRALRLPSSNPAPRPAQ